MRYNWQQKDWPQFTFDSSGIEDRLHRYAEEVSFLAGRMTSFSDELRYDLIAENLATEALYNSQIEGVRFSVEELKSSILNNLYPEIKKRHVSDYRAENLGRLMAENRKTYSGELTFSSLFEWHELLLAHRSDVVGKGAWRTGDDPMQIVSGAYGQQKIHFEAPPSSVVPHEMEQWLEWFNTTSRAQYAHLFQAPLRAGIAHIWFESIHPFEDGNGRLGRIIAEKSLAQGLGFPLPFSLSYAIIQKQSAYYEALQTGSYRLDLTKWLNYFLDVCLLGLDLGRKTIDLTSNKARFYDRFEARLSAKELKAIGKMFAAGPKGFAGGMTTKKYANINKVSYATASRDLSRLAGLGALERRGAGRSTHYVLPELT
jgi:Fic family protein